MSELRTWSREELAATVDRITLPTRLTQRQVEILRGIAKGYLYAEIAQQLYVSEATVKNDLQAVLRTMNARKASQAVALAYECGVLQAGDAHREASAADKLLHDCPGQCGTKIIRNMLSCRDCWYLLPGRLRGALDEAYPKRQTDPVAYREALAACLAWYRTNTPVPVGR